VEGDGREKKRFARFLHALGLGFPLSLSLSQIRKFSKQGMAGVMLGAMLVIDHALVLDTKEKRFCFKKEE
jgi:hypothetical protein